MLPPSYVQTSSKESLIRTGQSSARSVIAIILSRRTNKKISTDNHQVSLKPVLLSSPVLIKIQLFGYTYKWSIYFRTLHCKTVQQGYFSTCMYFHYHNCGRAATAMAREVCSLIHLLRYNNKNTCTICVLSHRLWRLTSQHYIY